MRIFFLAFLFLISFYSQAQIKDLNGGSGRRPATNTLNDSLSSRSSSTKSKQKPPINQYKIISFEKDTAYIDTSLTIKKEYKYNYLRKDLFGKQAFANEGQMHNTLYHGYKNYFNDDIVRLGYDAKHFNYLHYKDINTFYVPIPVTDLYFKTVMRQGQSVDAFVTLNTSKQFNLSLAYKGIRSLGEYVNALTSNGNFRLTSSYNSKNNKYILDFYFVGQDLFNEENGGLADVNQFLSSVEPFNTRDRLDVYFEDASSKLKGNRYTIQQSYQITKNIKISHFGSQEYKFYEFIQNTPSERLGTSFSNKVNNKTRYQNWNNKIGVHLKSFLGEIYGTYENYFYKQYYNNVLFDSQASVLVPSQMDDIIHLLGAGYVINKKAFHGKAYFYNSITNQDLSGIKLEGSYQLNDTMHFMFTAEKKNHLPSLTYQFLQSAYVSYNWFNSFVNEKITQFNLQLQSKWVNIETQFKSTNDYLYFTNTASDTNLQLVKPVQYQDNITYVSIKASKEIKYKKWGLDNTLLFQTVSQNNPILNVPQWVTRNSLYFSEHLFKKAMFLQTGLTLNYFSKYYANEYNPIIGDFFVQNNIKVGNYPFVDLFINAKVKQARIYIKAEHINALFKNFNYLITPTNPYRDFIIRFGLEWNMFR